MELAAVLNHLMSIYARKKKTEVSKIIDAHRALNLRLEDIGTHFVHNHSRKNIMIIH
jgi:hypothetical protein